jgi:hypothetical protein
MTLRLDILAAAIFLVLVIIVVAIKLRTKRLDKRYFQKRWVTVQKMCTNKKMWYQAVIDADELLDEALKQSHFHGKTTGERLVAAQRTLSSNDSVWFGHKLKKHIIDDNYKRLNKKDTLAALAGFRQALKDLGALATDKKTGPGNDR